MKEGRKKERENKEVMPQLETIHWSGINIWFLLFFISFYIFYKSILFPFFLENLYISSYLSNNNNSVIKNNNQVYSYFL